MFKSPLLRSYGLWHWGEGLQTVLFTWTMIFHAQLSAPVDAVTLPRSRQFNRVD